MWYLGAYHLGFTTDLNQFIRILHERYPSKKLYLSGFSLGGNVILKLLGELQDEAVDLNINGAVVTCVPFDPLQSQGKIDKGFNRLVYSSVSLLDTNSTYKCNLTIHITHTEIQRKY